MDKELYEIIEDAISWGILHPDFKKYDNELEVKIKEVGESITEHFKKNI